MDDLKEILKAISLFISCLIIGYGEFYFYFLLICEVYICLIMKPDIMNITTEL